MREILFRGKSKAQGSEWLYGDVLIYENSAQIWETINSRKYNSVVSLETIGQYTGLTDKNGKKVFEGDIVKGAWDTVFQVVYDDCYLGFRAERKDGFRNSIDYYGLDRIEVIGNIHDNSELMKGENNDIQRITQPIRNESNTI